jgi:hypothetical protein
MPPNGSTSVQCSAAYFIPPSRTPKTYQVRAQVATTARAVVEADIQQLIDDVRQELGSSGRGRAFPGPAAPMAAKDMSEPKAQQWLGDLQ